MRTKMTTFLIPISLGSLFLMPVISPAASRADAFAYCREFIKSSPYSPTLNKFTDTFSLDADGGIHDNQSAIKNAKLSTSKSEIAMNLEGGHPPESMYTLRIEDQGGDPRHFLMNEMSLQMPPGEAPVIQTFDYTFVFNRGVCVPSRVVSTTGGTARVLFDLDECHAQTKKGDLDCTAWPQTAKILKDPRLSFAPIESSPNGAIRNGPSSQSRGTR